MEEERVENERVLVDHKRMGYKQVRNLNVAGDVTESLIRKSTSLKQFRHESDARFFERITNLNLQNKSIRRIGGLDQCTQVRVLYLYENEIERIENLSFARHLTHLYLENNRIQEMSLELRALHRLVKLNLEGNAISYVQGLENCSVLEELKLSNQKISRPLEFDIASMEAIANSLHTLTIENDGLSSLAPIHCLVNLHTLRAGLNKLNDPMDLRQLLANCSLLKELDLRGNPVARATVAQPDGGYRDFVILHSNLLSILDNKPVKPNQRAFLQARESRRLRNRRSETRREITRQGPEKSLQRAPETILASSVSSDGFEQDRHSVDGSVRHSKSSPKVETTDNSSKTSLARLNSARRASKGSGQYEEMETRPRNWAMVESEGLTISGLHISCPRGGQQK